MRFFFWRVVLVSWSGWVLAGCAGASNPDDPSGGGGRKFDTIWIDPDLSSLVGAGCSSDLQSVLDESGNVKGKCPAEQGCSAGQCVTACEASSVAKGSFGCEFITSTPVMSDTIQPSSPCFAVFLANTWGKDAKVTVEYNGQSLDATEFGRIPDGSPDPLAWGKVPPTGIPVGGVAVLFLSGDPSSVYIFSSEKALGCPATPAVAGATENRNTAAGKAFRIKTDVPVSAYDVMPFGGSASFLPSAQLLFPVTTWGSQFVIASAPNRSSRNLPSNLSEEPYIYSWFQVLATADNTSLQVTPIVDLLAGPNVEAIAAGQTGTYTLKAGDYVQWHSRADNSGSVVTSDQPVAVVAGQPHLYLRSASNRPNESGGAESSHQPVAPVTVLGFEYVGAPYMTRRADLKEESIIYRLVGVADGTKLTYDPPVQGAPAALAKGQVADFEAIGPFVIRSQDSAHMYHMAQAMSGGFLASGSRPGASNGGEVLGDPDIVPLLPPAQSLSQYVFFTDPTYATTNLTLVRNKTAAGFKDVTVECLGTISGWKPVGSGGNYETTTVDLIREFKASGSCKNGRQGASSEGPFGVMVWGLDHYASYGYPGGGNAQVINSVMLR